MSTRSKWGGVGVSLCLFLSKQLQYIPHLSGRPGAPYLPPKIGVHFAIFLLQSQNKYLFRNKAKDCFKSPKCSKISIVSSCARDKIEIHRLGIRGPSQSGHNLANLSPSTSEGDSKDADPFTISQTPHALPCLYWFTSFSLRIDELLCTLQNKKITFSPLCPPGNPLSSHIFFYL